MVCDRVSKIRLGWLGLGSSIRCFVSEIFIGLDDLEWRVPSPRNCDEASWNRAHSVLLFGFTISKLQTWTES